jgi:hypothetical protein
MGLFQAFKQNMSNFVKAPCRVFMSYPSIIIWGVVGSTYIAANTLDVYSEHQSHTASKASTIKLFGATAINMPANLAKDLIFTKMFANRVPEAASITAAKVPAATCVLFLTSYLVTMAGSFTGPAILSNAMV